jgi:hypothetical protein
MILNKINCKRIYKFVPSGPNIVIFLFIILLFPQTQLELNHNLISAG